MKRRNKTGEEIPRQRASARYLVREPSTRRRRRGTIDPVIGRNPRKVNRGDPGAVPSEEENPWFVGEAGGRPRTAIAGVSPGIVDSAVGRSCWPPRRCSRSAHGYPVAGTAIAATSRTVKRGQGRSKPTPTRILVIDEIPHRDGAGRHWAARGCCQSAQACAASGRSAALGSTLTERYPAAFRKGTTRWCAGGGLRRSTSTSSR